MAVVHVSFLMLLLLVSPPLIQWLPVQRQPHACYLTGVFAYFFSVDVTVGVCTPVHQKGCTPNIPPHMCYCICGVACFHYDNVSKLVQCLVVVDVWLLLNCWCGCCVFLVLLLIGLLAGLLVGLLEVVVGIVVC